jgi:hypothetical protein
VNKLKMLTAGAVAAGAVAVGATAVFGSSVAASDPGGTNSMNVVGESYARAVSILKSQGVKATFGGSVGSDVPQAQCIVDQEKMGSHGRVILMLNCTTKAVENASAGAPASGGGTAGAPGAPQGPHVGSNGVTTVQATPVGPQPGMSIPGM